MSLSAAYRSTLEDTGAVIAGLTDAQLQTPVPAAPDWTVHDLLAHLAGASADLAGGRSDGVASESRTARQVEDRRDRTTEELMAEWRANADAVARLCDQLPGPNPAWDVAVHLADLRETVGLDPLPPEQGWGEVLDATTAFLAERGAVTVSVAERGPDPGTTTWHFATTYGLWRALFSRLSPTALGAEVLRGDRDAFASMAFFGD